MNRTNPSHRFEAAAVTLAELFSLSWCPAGQEGPDRPQREAEVGVGGAQRETEGDRERKEGEKQGVRQRERDRKLDREERRSQRLRVWDSRESRGERERPGNEGKSQKQRGRERERVRRTYQTTRAKRNGKTKTPSHKSEKWGTSGQM